MHGARNCPLPNALGLRACTTLKDMLSTGMLSYTEQPDKLEVVTYYSMES